MFKPMKKYQKAAAFAAAFVLAATTFAASPTTWFDAGISSYENWPATGWASSSETVPVASMATINAGALEIDTSDAELQYGVESVGLTYAPLVISSKQKFTPAAADTELPDPADAKGGLAVVKVDDSYAYYGIVKVEGANTWVALAGATPSDPANTEVATTITITDDDGAAKIAYAVEGTPLTYNSVSANDIANVSIANGVEKIAYAGCGVVSALSGTKVVPEYAITVAIPDGAKFAVDELTVGGVAQQGVGGVYTLPLGAEYTITFVATDGDYEISGSPIIGTVAGAVTVDISGITATEKTYYVTYKANEGTGEDVKQGYKKSDTTAPVAKAVGTEEGECAFARLGYTFAGWNTAADGSGTAYAAAAELPKTSGGYELFAQWTIVNYDIEVVGGEANAATYTVAGATVNLTKGADPAGKEFASWTADPAAGVSFVGDVMTIAANTTGKITVTCNFSFKNYTIEATKCEVSQTTYTYEGAQITVKAIEANPGYEFTGWTVSVGEVVEGVWTIPAEKTGVQTIEANFAKATYTIVINANDGQKTVADPTYQIGLAQQITLTKPTAPANMEFDKWELTTKDGVEMDGDVVKIAAEVYGTINVKALWKAAEPVGPVIDPTQGETEAKDVVAESDTAAAAAVIAAIKAPVVAGMELTDADYQGYFTATAVPAESGKTGAYDVTLALNPEVVEPEETMTAAAAAVVSGATEAAVTNAKPGLFYSFKYSGDVTAVTGTEAAEGERVQATSTSVTIPVPQDAKANVRFWVLNVSTVGNKLGD